MKERRSVWISLLCILNVIAAAFTWVGAAYGPALDQHFGYGKVLIADAGPSGLEARYYDVRFTSDQGKDGTLAHADAVSKQITDEGIILLKNNGALPLDEGAAVTPLGFRFLHPVYGGTGSGAAHINEGFARSPEAALRDHFALNEAVLRAMDRAWPLRITADAVDQVSPAQAGGSSAEVYEYPAAMYDGLESLCEGTAGIVFIGRVGGESSNYSILPLADGTPHTLALTQAEREAITFSKQHCRVTIAVINSANVMEIGDLMAGPMECDAILWAGGPGNTGFQSLADVLAGSVNPSGRTPDIWPADLLADPALQNFCDILYANSAGVAYASNYDGTVFPAGLYYIEYEEGIYNGYRYYETADALGEIAYGALDGFGGVLVNGAVNYPFGYGLSYTSFTQRITSCSYEPDSGMIRLTVEVTNIGVIDGKETVQLYFQPPYTDDDREMQIEKAAKNLIAFEKVSLKSGETKQITLSFRPEDMASYCMTRQNPDGSVGCYCLEQGEYRLILGKNSHEEWDDFVFAVQETVFYDTGNPRISEQTAQHTGSAVAAVNRFSDVTAYMMEEGITILTRANWRNTQPTPPEKKTLSEARLARASGYDPWTDPYTGNEGIYTQHPGNIRQKQQNGLALADMRGRAYDDPLWETYLDQIDYQDPQLWDLLLTSSMHTASVDLLGKPRSQDRDGPQGLHGDRRSSFTTYAYCAEVMLAATFNVDLADAFGESIGQEALLIGLTGWYGPGLNVHRGAFCGRNFEYYSEDPLLSGRMAARCISGAASCGVVCYVKHFAMNNYEGPATCLTVWATEQTIRETYLRSFEIAVKEAETSMRYYADGIMTEKAMRAALGIMGAANLIGTEWCAANYALLQGVLREEWGFQGAVTTDMSLQIEPGVADKIFRNGGDLRMYYYMPDILDRESPEALACFRRAVKNICYAYANSNLLEGVAPGTVVRYGVAPWRIGLIVFAALIGLADLLLAFYFLVKRKCKRTPAAHPS